MSRRACQKDCRQSCRQKTYERTYEEIPRRDIRAGKEIDKPELDIPKYSYGMLLIEKL